MEPTEDFEISKQAPVDQPVAMRQRPDHEQHAAKQQKQTAVHYPPSLHRNHGNREGRGGRGGRLLRLKQAVLQHRQSGNMSSVQGLNSALGRLGLTQMASMRVGGEWFLEGKPKLGRETQRRVAGWQVLLVQEQGLCVEALRRFLILLSRGGQKLLDFD